MTNISSGTYHYHTLVSTIITRYIMTDYTQRLASFHLLCQTIITHSYPGKLQKREFNLFQRSESATLDE